MTLDILSRTAGIQYTLLDFSPAMHILAKRRLASIDCSAVQYLECDFKNTGWSNPLGQYDAILTNQAVHELRHKRDAPDFFMQIRGLLKPDGILLFCDQYYGDDGMRNDQLYMSLEEQRGALASAGFKVSEVLVKGGRALHCALLEAKGAE